MKLGNILKTKAYSLALLPLFGVVPISLAQIPVDDDGQVIGDYESAANPPGNGEHYSSAELGNEGIPLLSRGELEELVGPVALYPDDLLAVVLPASTFPLQVVQAGRFLDDLESNPDLKPDPKWDDSVIALLNYPEVVELLNDDLDWTWRLGEAVVAQQGDVVIAVEAFRNRAYAAGNLKSDEHQRVSHDDGVIEIAPAQEDVIYVPYYEPAHVVVHQPRPVYHYYSRPCPVYYYPYPNSYAFNRGYFWGVTTAFAIGWRYDHLRVFHHSYHGHPYYGRSYWNRWWYRRPSLNVYNRNYIRNSRRVVINRRLHGDHWRPSRTTRVRFSDGRITRTRNHPASRTHTRNYESRRNFEQPKAGGFIAPKRQTQLRRVRPAASLGNQINRANTSRRHNRDDSVARREPNASIGRSTQRTFGPSTSKRTNRTIQPSQRHVNREGARRNSVRQSNSRRSTTQASAGSTERRPTTGTSKNERRSWSSSSNHRSSRQNKARRR